MFDKARNCFHPLYIFTNTDRNRARNRAEKERDRAGEIKRWSKIVKERKSHFERGTARERISTLNERKTEMERGH